MLVALVMLLKWAQAAYVVAHTFVCQVVLHQQLILRQHFLVQAVAAQQQLIKYLHQ
jgi:hypothetical protein